MNYNVCMPHFIIYGGMKCGTTSLWEYLGEHPDVLHVKDDHYFFPERIRDLIQQQIDYLSAKEKKWLFRDFEFRDFTQRERKLLPNKLLPAKRRLNASSHKIKRTLQKLNRPIIGSKEVRWFGPSHFKWATYFSKSFVEPLDWYIDSFPTVPKFHGTEHEENYGKITGEASPTYLHGNNIVIERVKYFLPDVRLIILLRNPVDRFLSMQRMKDGMADAVKSARVSRIFCLMKILFFFEVAEGKEVKKRGDLTLDELVMYSDAGFKTKEELSEEVGGVDKSKIKKINRDLKASRYAEKISKVLTTFDSDQVLVIQSEYFYKQTVDVMHEIETFLEISHMGKDKWAEITSHVYNLVMDGKNRTFAPQEGKQNSTIHVELETRELLENYYMDSNEELAEILEMRFDGWSYP